jgi:hypothetical protein
MDENMGESAITTSPQKIRKIINGTTGSKNAHGENRQQHPDKDRDIKAVFFAPHICER